MSMSSEPHAKSNGHVTPPSTSALDSRDPRDVRALASTSSLEERIVAARGAVTRVEAGLSASILGQAEVVASVVHALLAGGHVLLEGAPGLGKTQIVRTLAQLMGGTFTRIQFTPDLMPSDVTGTSLVVTRADGTKDLAYRPGPIFANLVLADEINRATPKTQSALLEAMAERTVTVDGQPRALPHPFFVLATENPIEMEGVYPLPEAQLDRFLVKLVMAMPDLDTLAKIGARSEEPPAPTAVTSPEEWLLAQSVARSIPAAPHVERYAAKLVVATHQHLAARYGAGPRAVQALMSLGRARALIAGRAAVAAQDIAASAHHVLRHRIGLRFEADASGVTTEAVVRDVLASTQVE